MLASACSATSGAPPAQPASAPAIDPLTEIIEIPEGQCEPISGWYAFSPRALDAVLKKQTERARACNEATAKAETAERIAKAERDAALDALAKAQWWQRYGPIVAGAAAGVTLVGGAVIGFELGRAPRLYRPPRRSWHLFRPTLRAYGH